jgi:hypothetical protein
MPTIFIVFGFCFKFYSNDHEPVHIHVTKDGHEAKFNLEPLALVFNRGFKKHELTVITGIIEENVEILLARWNEYFKGKQDASQD